MQGKETTVRESEQQELTSEQIKALNVWYGPEGHGSSFFAARTIVIIDVKGSRELFQDVLKAAKESGVPFKTFNLERAVNDAQ